MAQPCKLLLGSSGYLGRTLATQLQPFASVILTHRSQPLFADSQRYDFGTDDVHSLIEQHQVGMVIVAANMAYEAAHNAYIFQQRAELLIRGCQRFRVIYVSSDAVFDRKKGAYTERRVHRKR